MCGPPQRTRQAHNTQYATHNNTCDFNLIYMAIFFIHPVLSGFERRRGKVDEWVWSWGLGWWVCQCGRWDGGEG